MISGSSRNCLRFEGIVWNLKTLKSAQSPCDEQTWIKAIFLLDEFTVTHSQSNPTAGNSVQSLKINNLINEGYFLVFHWTYARSFWMIDSHSWSLFMISTWNVGFLKFAKFWNAWNFLRIFLRYLAMSRIPMAAPPAASRIFAIFCDLSVIFGP